MPKIVLMLVKKAAYYVMAAGPILLLGLIAVNSRTSASSWQFVEYSPETTKRIKAYIGPVAKAEHLYRFSRSEETEMTRETVDFWLSAFRTGVLKDIPPVTTMLEPDTGVYQQIADARTYVLSRAKKYADSLVYEGEFDKAALAYVDAIEIGYIAKYSEFSILTESAAKQSMYLGNLESILPKVSEPTQVEVRTRLEGLAGQRRPFVYVVDHYAVAYQGDLHRLGTPGTLIEAARETRNLAIAQSPEQTRIDRWRALSKADRDLLPLFGSSRLAQASEDAYVARLAQAIGSLTPVPTSG